MKSVIISITSCLFLFLMCAPSKEKPVPQLDKVKLPDGFKIEYYAKGIENARSLELSPSGVLYVGNRGKDKVYALKDTDGDFKVDETHIIASGLHMPNGVAYRDGDLYVAERSRILKFPDIEKDLSNPPTPEVIYDKYPTEDHHGWKYIDFGPDGKLYVPVGAPCNICDSEDEVFASITRMDADGSNVEVVQHGVRNTVGFTWHPETGDMWFTDNGRDYMGDDMPSCELNRAPEDQMHFGYPYCHQGDTLDDEFGAGKSCDDYTAPSYNLGAHVAPLGLEFYQGKQFPDSYNKRLFIAEHGSWNRTEPVGYRVTMVTLEGDEVVDHGIFAEGFRHNGTNWGRPVDMEFLPDGSMLLSDDLGDAIYRISYTN